MKPVAVAKFASTSKRVSVAWECWHCLKRHLWTCPREDAAAGADNIVMHCGLCRRGTKTALVQIGVDAYAAIRRPQFVRED